MIREKETATVLHRALQALEPPDDFFSGLRLKRSLCPDNILLFKRLSTPDFRPGEVTDNLHHRFELVIVLEQEGVVTIGGSRYRLEPGEAALIFPNQFHHYMDVREGPIRWLFITFELEVCEGMEPLRDKPRRLSAEAMELTARIARDYSRKDRQKHALAIAYQLGELLRCLVGCPPIPAARRGLQTANPARDQVLEKINAYVRQNFADAPTLQRLAGELGYSESHLRTLFRDELGISLGRYIRTSRLCYASQLLQEGRYAIAEVASLSGFDSPFAFSRAFKNAYGTTPKAYSKQFSNHP